jgi:Sugar phosphate isomerases/epimerases
MKTHLLRFVLPFVSIAAFASAQTASFKDHLGLQMWSLREIAKESTIKALDQAKEYGFKEIEAVRPADMSIEEYAAAVKQRGFTVPSVHASYEPLVKNPAEAIAFAKALGAKYVTCPWARQGDKPWTVEAAKEIAANFNKIGEACKAAGLQFAYHPHGYEFVATGGARGETVFDVFARETNPDLVKLQMDVFWVYHAGQSPMKLLEKYGDRWFSLHVKDIRKGAITNLSTGHAAPTDNVAVGTGQIDWKAVIGTAQKVGVKFYIVEDETPAPLQAIPASLKYLKGLEL